MEYQLCPAFAIDMPWRSELSGRMDEEKIFSLISEHFPYAKEFVSRLFESTRKDINLKKTDTEGGRVLAARKFSTSGFDSLTPVERDAFCAKIRQHQFLDVLLFLCGPQPSGPPPDFQPPVYINVPTAFSEAQKGFRNLPKGFTDWGKIVTKAHHQFYLKELAKAREPAEPDEALLSPTALSAAGHRARFMRTRNYFGEGSCGIITGNLCSMIFFAGYLFGGKLDLPHKMSLLERELEVDPLARDPQWVAAKKLKPGLLKGPMATALAISPLAALIPVNLENRTMSEWGAFSKIWAALGNIKPTSLRQAEAKIWSFVIHWAHQQGDVAAQVPHLISELLEIVQTASKEDLTWFTEFDVRVRHQIRPMEPLSPTSIPGPSTSTIEPVSTINPAQLEGNLHMDMEDMLVVYDSDGDTQSEDGVQPTEDEGESEEKGSPIRSHSLSPSPSSTRDVPLVSSATVDLSTTIQSTPHDAEMDTMDISPASGADENEAEDHHSHADLQSYIRSSKQSLGKRKRLTRPRKAKKKSVPAQVVSSEETTDDDGGVGGVGNRSYSSKAMKKMRRLYDQFVRQIQPPRPIEAHVGLNHKVEGEPMKIPIPTSDGSLQYHTFTPVFHHQSQLEQVDALYKAFLPNQDTPLNHPSSPFQILDWNQYQDLQPGNVLEGLRHKNLVILGRPLGDSIGVSQNIDFNQDGLQLLGPLSQPTIMHDLSKPMGPDDDYEIRHVSGTLGDLLTAKEEGRSLNLLDCPFDTDYGKPQAWDLQWIAWQHVRNHVVRKTHGSFPMHVHRWGLAATSGSMHTWHVDSCGFLSIFTVATGIKIFAFGVPKPGYHLSSIDAFASFNIEQLNTDHMEVFMIALLPSMQLIQTAHQPHFVITPKDSIVLGGHALVTPALQQTTTSIYHQFVLGKFITNNDLTAEAFTLLSAITIFFHQQIVEKHLEYDPQDKVLCHLPRLDSMEGLLDLLALAHLMELATVLCPWAYEPPVEHPKERFAMIATRRTSRELVAFVFGTYELLDENGDSVHGADSLFHDGLVNICVALTLLKRLHEQTFGGDDSDIDSRSMEAAIFRTLVDHEDRLEAYHEGIVEGTCRDFLYHGPQYTVRRRLPHGVFPELGDHIHGFTFDDKDTGIMGE